MMRYSLGLPEVAGRRYWLVETASLPEHEVLRRFYEVVEAPECRWLYQQTRLDAMKEAGPVLLDVTAAPTFPAEQLEAWGGVAGVIIDTPLSIEEVQAHLARLVTVRLKPEGEGVWRFHEPMALHLMLGEGLLDRTHRAAMQGQEARWYWPICRCHDGWLFESAVSDRTEAVQVPWPVTLEAATVRRLSGIQQLSRLMPVLADLLDRHALQEDTDAITALWLDLEGYWIEVAQSRQPARQAVEALARAQRDASSLRDFRDRMQRLAHTG